MKIKLNSDELHKIKAAAIDVYTNSAVQNFNREDFLAYCYLISVVSWLDKKGIKVSLDEEQPIIEPLE